MTASCTRSLGRRRPPVTSRIISTTKPTCSAGNETGADGPDKDRRSKTDRRRGRRESNDGSAASCRTRMKKTRTAATWTRSGIGSRHRRETNGTGREKRKRPHRERGWTRLRCGRERRGTARRRARCSTKRRRRDSPTRRRRAVRLSESRSQPQRRDGREYGGGTPATRSRARCSTKRRRRDSPTRRRRAASRSRERSENRISKSADRRFRTERAPSAIVEGSPVRPSHRFADARGLLFTYTIRMFITRGVSLNSHNILRKSLSESLVIIISGGWANSFPPGKCRIWWHIWLPSISLYCGYLIFKTTRSGTKICDVFEKDSHVI